MTGIAKMNKLELKYNNKNNTNIIKKYKIVIKNNMRNSVYYMNCKDDFLKSWGYRATGVYSHIQNSIKDYQCEARAFNIVNAFVKGRRFDSVEKYYYNNGIQYQISLVTQDNIEYSKYKSRLNLQQNALDKAKIFLGLYEFKTSYSMVKNKKVEQINKVAIPDETFDKWVAETGNLF